MTFSWQLHWSTINVHCTQMASIVQYLQKSPGRLSHSETTMSTADTLFIWSNPSFPSHDEILPGSNQYSSDSKQLQFRSLDLPSHEIMIHDLHCKVDNLTREVLQINKEGNTAWQKSLSVQLLKCLCKSMLGQTKIIQWSKVAITKVECNYYMATLGPEVGITSTFVHPTSGLSRFDAHAFSINWSSGQLCAPNQGSRKF